MTCPPSQDLPRAKRKPLILCQYKYEQGHPHTHTETAEGASQGNERQPTKKNVISEVKHRSRSKTNRNSR